MRYGPPKWTDLHRPNVQKSPSFDMNILLHPFLFSVLIFLMLSSFLYFKPCCFGVVKMDGAAGVEGGTGWRFVAERVARRSAAMAEVIGA